MKSVHATLRINPEIVGKLGSGTGAFWPAEDEFGRIREMLIRQKGELYPE